jgi:hypothetical protein
MKRVTASGVEGRVSDDRDGIHLSETAIAIHSSTDHLQCR